MLGHLDISIVLLSILLVLYIYPLKSHLHTTIIIKNWLLTRWVQCQTNLEDTEQRQTTLRNREVPGTLTRWAFIDEFCKPKYIQKIRLKTDDKVLNSALKHNLSSKSHLATCIYIQFTKHSLVCRYTTN